MLPTPSNAVDPVRRPVAALALTAVAALALVGCVEEADSAQEAAVVPSDRETVQERADRSRVRGSEGAPVTVVEVSDFQCPFCARHHAETFPDLDRLYVQNDLVEYLFITFPSPNHPQSWSATKAAFCAGAVGKFWEMAHVLFEGQEDWSGQDAVLDIFQGYAEEAGIDGDSFRHCMVEDLPARVQVTDLQQVARAGIEGTPYFVVDGEISLQGAAPLDRFRSVLDSVLTDRGATPPSR